MADNPFVGVATGGYPASLDEAEARRALAVLADPEGFCQLVSVPSGACAVLPGGDVEGLLRAARDLSGGMHLYLRINPVRQGLAKASVLADHPRRRWLLVDVDAVREDSGQPSTDAEHEAARQDALAVIDDLAGQGWPAPVVIDSGNGWHLLYRVDLPNDGPTRELVRAALKLLSTAYKDCAGGRVDAGTHAATINTKLPGSMARKGTSTKARPHRPVRLVHVPAFVEVVDVALLEALAGVTLEGLAAQERGRRLPGRNPFTYTVPQAGREAYARRALDNECARVASSRPIGDGGTGRNNTLNEAAFSVGQLVGAGLLTRESVEAALLDAARSAGLSDREARSTLKSGLDAGTKQPRQVPERNGSHPPPHGEPVAPAPEEAAKPKPKAAKPPPAAQETQRPVIWRLPDLLAADLPAPNWAVPGLMSEGLTILGGKPKLGKSWLALNLALTIASGGKALGNVQVQPGDVLYLSLEDRLRRVKDRAAKVLSGLGLTEASQRLHIAVEWPRIDKGGLDELGIWLDGAERPALVIVDVWAKFRPVYKQGNQYDQDYQWAAAVKMVADDHGTSLLTVTHCKKGKAEDVVEEISGTLGLSGAADGLLVLTRARNENDAVLFTTGRDAEEREMAIQFDPKGFTWKHVGSPAELSESKYKTALIGVLRANAGATFSVAELYERVGARDDADRARVRQILTRAADAGEIARPRSGYYRYPVNEGDAL